MATSHRHIFVWSDRSMWWTLLERALLIGGAAIGLNEWLARRNRKVCEDEIYTPREVARLLDIPVEEVIRLLDAGRLSGRKVGGKYRILGRAVTDFLTGSDGSDSTLSASATPAETG